MLTFIFIVEHYKPIEAKTREYVAVYSECYRGIYRARVLKPDSENTNMVKCTLIDFGKVDMIPSKNIFALPNYVLLNKVSRKYYDTNNNT